MEKDQSTCSMYKVNEKENGKVLKKNPLENFNLCVSFSKI